MARVLSIVWYKILPARFGGQKGIAEFNNHLAKYHEFTCICSSNNEPSGHEAYHVIKTLPVSKSQVINPFAWQQIKKATTDFNASHVIIEHPYYGLTGIWLARKLRVKLIVHSHNIESDRFRQIGKWWWKILYWLEKKTHSAADLNLFKTEQDQEFATRNFGLDSSKCLVVPFGLNRNQIPTSEEKNIARRKVVEKHQLDPHKKIVLFNGSLDYSPNKKAVGTIQEKIIPLLVANSKQPFVVVLCGRSSDPINSDLQNENLLYAGEVENIGDYFMAADIFINPVTEGGGIRVKNMEGLSLNCTVVSTNSAAAGIDKAVTGKNLIIVPDNDWQTFANETVNNWEAGTDTPQAFFNKYSWEKIVKEVAAAIDSL